MQRTVGACCPVVEGWLSPLSSEKKNSFSLEHCDLDAAPGREAVATSAASFHFSSLSSWYIFLSHLNSSVIVQCTVVFSASCPNATRPCCLVLLAVDFGACFNHSVQLASLRKTTDPDQDWKLLNVLLVVIRVSVSFVWSLPHCGQNAIIGT